MSNEYGRGGNPNDPQGQPIQPQYQQGDYPQQPQGNYPPQNYQPQQSYQPQPGDYTQSQQAQPQYAQYQPVAPVAAPRSNRGLVTFLAGIVVVAALAVGGFFLWQNVLKPAVAGVAADKLLPSSTVGYFTYDARPSDDQQANWAKINDAFLSQPGVKEKLAMLGSQTGVGLNYVGQLAAQCGQSGSALDASILSNLNEFFAGNTTVAYLQPGDDEIRRVFQTITKGMGGTMGSMTNRPGISTGGAGNQQEAICAGLHLFEDHAIAIVELDANPTNTNGLISKLQAYNNGDKGQLTKDETYNGVDIYKFNFSGAAQNFYGMLIGKEAVVTANKDTAKLVVDAYKDSSKSLSANANYTAALAKLPADRTATIYMDAGKFASIASVMMDEASKMGGSMAASMGSMKGMYDQMKNSTGVSVMSVVARANGVQVDDASAGNTGMALTLPTIASRDFVNRLPDGVWGFFASNDVKGLVNQYLDLMGQQQAYFQSLGMGKMDAASLKQQFKQSTGLDLDEDVLSWMGGEFGAYLQPQGDDMSKTPDMVFALNIKDSKDKATTSLQKINQTIKDKMGSDTSEYAPKVAEVQVAGSTIYSYGNTYDNKFSGLYYGIVGDYFYLSSSSSAIETLNAAKGGLANSANYKSAMTNAITANSAQAYVNIQAISSGWEKYLNDRVAKNQGDEYYQRDLKNYTDNIKPFLAPFKGVAFSSDNSDKAGQHSVMFINIEK